MRAGICSVQQALTAEAASIVKQAVGLARRRGHAQVTPLHVASAMLASTNGLLRRACLQSHSHPLQCKALELCFNVALNRLPASTSCALLGPHSSYPSLSNALVAAFKRAQAHQRRGSIENQQQPILALKIEIEQLIISILDDPSVSRVMREAGFSSTQVKNNVEQYVSLEICSPTPTPTPKQTTKPQLFSTNNIVPPFSNDDVMSVLNTLMEKKRNTVITGECVATTESVIRGVMEKIEKGVAPGELRSVRFISFPLISLREIPKEEVEQKLVELRCIVKSYISRGVVLYLGDIKWVAEFYSDQRRSYQYCSGENIIMELKRLIRGFVETQRLWLLGISTFQTYMKCKEGHPSLETIWELYPLTIPVGSLTLTLNLNSDSQCHYRSKASTNGYSWPKLESASDNHLPCCTDLSVNLNREAQSTGCSQRDFTTNFTVSTTSSLPSWLKQHKLEKERITIDDKEYCTNTSPLLKKWNSFGSSSVHNKESHKTIKFGSSPPSPISISSHNTNLDEWPVIFEQRKFQKEHKFWMSECDDNNDGSETNLISVTKPELLSNPNSSPNSASSSEAMDGAEGIQSFKELNNQNMKILCSSLEKKVPWQKHIIPEIATTILECRSGMNKKSNNNREETWLFFLGVDSQGKEKIARELARLVYGSQANFVSIGLSNFSSTTEESKNKRGRDDELGCGYHERLGLALNENPHRVFFMEDVEQVDYCSQKAIKKTIQSGRIRLPGGENVPLKDAIFIFSCETFSSPSRKNEVKDDSDLSLDLNIAIHLDDDDRDEEDSDIAENGILQSVDKQIIFKIQQL